jgi:four helix bundle protein
MDRRKLELKQRTKRFAGRIIRPYVALPLRRAELAVLGRQMLRSGTSVAANYREASRARSPNEFVSKIELCAQEADETQLWLELLRDDCGVKCQELDSLWTEADELIAIFCHHVKKHEAEQQRPEG